MTNENISASNWGNLVPGILQSVVDTGAQIAVAKANTKQAQALQAATPAPVMQAPVSAPQTQSTDWKKIGIYAGIGVGALLAIVMIGKALK